MRSGLSILALDFAKKLIKHGLMVMQILLGVISGLVSSVMGVGDGGALRNIH